MKRIISQAAVITALTIGALAAGAVVPAAGGNIVTRATDRNWCC